MIVLSIVLSIIIPFKRLEIMRPVTHGHCMVMVTSIIIINYITLAAVRHNRPLSFPNHISREPIVRILASCEVTVLLYTFDRALYNLINYFKRYLVSGLVSGSDVSSSRNDVI